MAYDTFETSTESGRPIELFEFTIDTTVYRYTNAEDDITYSAEIYTSETIMRTSPTLSSSEGGRQQMEITLPADNPIAERYIGIVPADRVSLRVLRFHRGDSPNGIVLWDGRVVSVKFEKNGGAARLYSVSSESALSRPCPGRKYQSMCNHTLYDGLCQAVKASNKYSGNCSAVSGATITVDGVGSEGADWAVGGTVEYGNEKRLVTAQSGNVLTLQIPFPESPAGSAVDVYAGCDHLLTTCASKFSNEDNFGGFPYVPWVNPFSAGVE